MSNQFEVTIHSVEEVHSLPGIWSNESLRQLLIAADMDDIGQVEDAELLDIAIMALQDLGNQQAGELVLDSVFGDAMRPGVRQNLVDDLQEDKPWEEFAMVAQQRGLFIAVVLLQKVFPNRYAVPDALRFRFTIRALSSAAFADMNASDPAWLMRLLSQGMSDTDVLNRLCEEELKAGPFVDAAGMIWHFVELDDESGGEGGQVTGLSKSLDVIAPHVWLEPLKKGMVFNASAR
jgi:hypothetical protein